jgi:NitT/TauT family transport system substrate-binding protein
MNLPNRRRFLAQSAAALGLAAVLPQTARAATRIRFLMNWFAEAEHGGFYQAKALGLYEKAGLDVELAQGGPQVNVMQLLLGGQCDVCLGYDLQVLSGIEQGFPVRAIAASFQTDLQGLLVRPNVRTLADVKGSKVYMGNNGYTSYWPWLKAKYGYTDDMAAPKGQGLQTFMANPTSAAAGYVTAEPYYAQQAKVETKFLLFSDEGWPAYTNPLVTTEPFIAANRDALRPFLRASMEGWKSYMADPRAGNDLIKKMNPRMEDGHIDFSLARMREIRALQSGDAATRGIGTMSEDRWRRTRDFMVGAGLLKPETDWKKGFTTAFIDDVRVMM